MHTYFEGAHMQMHRRPEDRPCRLIGAHVSLMLKRQREQQQARRRGSSTWPPRCVAMSSFGLTLAALALAASGDWREDREKSDSSKCANGKIAVDLFAK